MVENEAAMLICAGHEVRRLIVSNDDIVGLASQVRTAVRALSNPWSVALVRGAIFEFNPDIVHFHNTFPTLTPGAVKAALDEGVPTIQTLHNFRTICVNGIFLYEGNVCEACLGHHRWPGLIRRCYRNSALGSAVVARVGRRFRWLCERYRKTYTLLALTEFARSKLAEDGYDPEQIVIKGNTTADPGAGAAARDRRIVFIGRLSAEKGADFLMEVAAGVNATVEFIGDGPDYERLAMLAGPSVVMRGWLDHDAAMERVKTAAAVAVPSRCYEGFPVVVVEALATGTPILVSEMGALPELVEPGRSGYVLPPGSVDAWRKTINTLLNEPNTLAKLGMGARAAYLDLHTEDMNVRRLIEIYESAIERAAGPY